MTKLLVVVLVVVLVLWLVKGRAKSDRRTPPPDRPGSAPGAPQPMVSCAHCGVHLPRAEALLLGEQTFCCAAHRDAGARRR